MADSIRVYIIWSCAIAIYHQMIRRNTKHTKYNPWPFVDQYLFNRLLLIWTVLITTRQSINRDLAAHSSDSNQTDVDSASSGPEGIQLVRHSAAVKINHIDYSRSKVRTKYFSSQIDIMLFLCLLCYFVVIKPTVYASQALVKSVYIETDTKAFANDCNCTLLMISQLWKQTEKPLHYFDDRCTDCVP